MTVFILTSILTVYTSLHCLLNKMTVYFFSLARNVMAALYRTKFN